MSSQGVAQRIESALDRRVVSMAPLSGGCVGDVRAVELDDGERVVAKVDPAGRLEVEGWMLRYLTTTSELPVPSVHHSESTLLLLEHVSSDGRPLSAVGEREAADLLAALHAVSAPSYGLERDTVIGGLPQPNPPTGSWPDFFRDHRLQFMGRRAHAAGRISSKCRARLDRFCARIAEWVEDPGRPSLVHGDVWSGNVLATGGRVAAFVDPAVYYADPEVELAFISLFSTFGDAFFSRYRERAGIRAGFFDVRRDVYNLYPLLVHAELFGGSYGASVDRTLQHLVG